MPDSRLRGFLSALVLTFLAVACAQTAHAQQAATPAVSAETARAASETRAALKTASETTPAPAVADDDRKTLTASSSNNIAAESGFTASIRKPRPFAVPRDEVFAPRRQDDQSGSQSTYTPLTSEQKMKRAFKSAFLSPAGYAWTAFNAALTEIGEEDLPHKDTEDRIADWGSRFAIQFGRRAARSLLGSGVYPVIFKQEPRYIKSNKKGFAPRALYAASRVFVTRGDNGNSQFNISRVAGNISASALSNLWEQSTPGRDRIGTGPTFRRVASMFISDAIFNIFREFW